MFYIIYMFSFFSTISKTIQKQKKSHIILAVLIIACSSYYIYTQLINPDKEHFDNSNGTIVTFYAFDYCGYCKKFKPTWDAVKNLNLDNVTFRYYESNTLTPEQKNAISHYVESKYAPNVILTVDGKNIEFDQQGELPHKGLDVFIKSNGSKYANVNSEHV